MSTHIIFVETLPILDKILLFLTVIKKINTFSENRKVKK